MPDASNPKATEVIQYYPVDKLVPPERPLRSIVPVSSAEINRLSASIEVSGIQNPLLVRPLPGGRALILDGVTRWASASRTRLDQLPCLVLKEEADPESDLLTSVTSNAARLKTHPLDMGFALKRLMDTGRFAQESDLAAAVGLSPSRVAQFLRLAGLPGEVVSLFRGRLRTDAEESGTENKGVCVTERHLRALCALNDHRDLLDEQVRVAGTMLEGQWQASRVESEVRRVLAEAGKGAKRGRPRKTTEVLIPGMPDDVTVKAGPGQVTIRIACDVNNPEILIERLDRIRQHFTTNTEALLEQ